MLDSIKKVISERVEALVKATEGRIAAHLDSIYGQGLGEARKKDLVEEVKKQVE